MSSLEVAAPDFDGLEAALSAQTAMLPRLAWETDELYGQRSGLRPEAILPDHWRDLIRGRNGGQPAAKDTYWKWTPNGPVQANGPDGTAATTATQTGRSALTFNDAADLLETELEHVTYDLFGLIAPGQITVYGGNTGAGKTPLLARTVYAMLTAADEFVGIEHGIELPDDYRFVWLTQESEYTFKPMLEAAGLTPEVMRGRVDIVYLHEALGTGKKWPEIIDGAAEKVGPRGLLIVDPLADWAMVRNEDDNAVMSEAFRPLVRAVGSGRSALVVAHGWKSTNEIRDEEIDVMHVRGAGAIVSNASIIAVYKKSTEMKDENVRYLKVVRSRLGDQIEPRYLELRDDGKLHTIELLDRAVRKAESARSDILATITAGAPEGSKFPDRVRVADLKKMHPWRKVQDGIAMLEAEGSIRAVGKSRSSTDPLGYVPAEPHGLGPVPVAVIDDED